MPYSPNDLPVGRPLMDEALLAHAQLSRAAWAVLQAFSSDPLPVTFALGEAMDALRRTQRQTPVHCACHPPGSSGDWCTGHCGHPTTKKG